MQLWEQKVQNTVQVTKADIFSNQILKAGTEMIWEISETTTTSLSFVNLALTTRERTLM